MSDVRLICGDCLNILPTLAGVDAVVTDPPYGIGWDTDYQFGIDNSSAPYAKNMVRPQHRKIANDDKPFDPTHLLDFGIVVLWGCNYFLDKLPAGSLLVWDKRDNGNKAFMSEAEVAWCSKLGAAKMYSHCWQGFSRASENSQHFHPTQKPVTLMKWCMDKAGIPVGATVLDPYMGSGSTGVACMQTGRNFIGIEKDRDYFKTAQRRITESQSQLIMPIFESVASD